ncbi:MAG: hypothetical protein A2201_09230 [Alicyclobacillus sp. RIFOXYA1_FULL_53_8]|nr:MAG: hypothetical protein A2201_09230 [Alicyclobacillus sp. RIFOXYA1_FULL_53_8]
MYATGSGVSRAGSPKAQFEPYDYGAQRSRQWCLRGANDGRMADTLLLSTAIDSNNTSVLFTHNMMSVGTMVENTVDFAL